MRKPLFIAGLGLATTLAGFMILPSTRAEANECPAQPGNVTGATCTLDPGSGRDPKTGVLTCSYTCVAGGEETPKNP